jgi:L-fuculose-phosphate aldolase
VTGDALLQPFDQLKEAEFSALSLVMGHSQGGLAAIGAEPAEELRHQFFP